MPHSHPFGKAWAVPLYAGLAPGRVVDVGPGAGMWADALRPVHRGFWTGLEVWGPYVESYSLAGKYDEVIVGDVRYVDLPDADLVIAGDVLEHVDEEDAVRLVSRWRDEGRGLLVSVPVRPYHQGALEGNPFEAHRWHPTHDWALDVVAPDQFTVGDVVGAYWRDPR